MGLLTSKSWRFCGPLLPCSGIKNTIKPGFNVVGEVGVWEELVAAGCLIYDLVHQALSAKWKPQNNHNYRVDLWVLQILLGSTRNHIALLHVSPLDMSFILKWHC